MGNSKKKSRNMNSIKNSVFNTYKNMAEKLKPIPTDSKFFEQGI